MDQLGYIPSNVISISSRRGQGSDKDVEPTPLALRTYPLNGGASRRKAKARGRLTPFPTLYWMCCPVIGKAIADLERRGFVRLYEERLIQSPDDWHQFVMAHKDYAEERWSILSDSHRYMIENNLEGMNAGMKHMIQYSGIAGTDYKSFDIRLLGTTQKNHAADDHPIQHANLAVSANDNGILTSMRPSIKCLHAHYAHYRSQVSSGRLHENEEINIVGKWIHQSLQDEFPELII